MLAVATTLSACVGTDYVDLGTSSTLRIELTTQTLTAGEEVALRATLTDTQGATLTVDASWQSSDTSIVAIDGNLLLARRAGQTLLVARYLDLVDSVVVFVSDAGTSLLLQRQGVFMDGQGSYMADGQARLVQTAAGGLQLVFESDFRVSNGPSIYVFLANKTSGPFAYEQGGQRITVESAQITSARLTSFQGMRTYDLPADIDLEDYDYVVLYCILGPVFGYAPLGAPEAQ
ncbi:MAG: hypothetical protein OHK0039_23040 [Bacteroidia bacterium]